MLTRSKPIRKRRGARRGPWRSEKYRRYIASLPCLICGGASQAAHTVNNGMSSKGSDASCVPLCPDHHGEYDRGRLAFERLHNVSMASLRSGLNLLWVLRGNDAGWERAR